MAKKQSKPKAARKPRVSESSRSAGVGNSRIGNSASGAAPATGKRRGFGVQKSGNAYNVRTPLGTLNTRRGCSRTLSLFLLPVLALLGLAIVPALGRKGQK